MAHHGRERRGSRAIAARREAALPRTLGPAQATASRSQGTYRAPLTPPEGCLRTRGGVLLHTDRFSPQTAERTLGARIDAEQTAAGPYQHTMSLWYGGRGIRPRTAVAKLTGAKLQLSHFRALFTKRFHCFALKA